MTALGLDDHHSRVDLSEMRVQSTLRALDKRLAQWKAESAWETHIGMPNPSVSSDQATTYYCNSVSSASLSLHSTQTS